MTSLKLNRRQFITSVTTASCAAALPVNLSAATVGNENIDQLLKQEIARYGNLLSLEQHADHIEVQVQIQDMNELSTACRAFSTWGKVYAQGNRLSFEAEQFHVAIHNRV